MHADAESGLQAKLPDRDLEGLRDTLRELQHQTSGNPDYAKYHAQHARCLWEACRAARHVLSSAHIWTRHCVVNDWNGLGTAHDYSTEAWRMLQVGSWDTPGSPERMQADVPQGHCPRSHSHLHQALGHLSDKERGEPFLRVIELQGSFSHCLDSWRMSQQSCYQCKF